ncbi:MAG TPA: diguanylate cyclase, partial [Spongiibacteraceae bacterium]|nr:diguanylate cyclase [Spongiibacteraceae bacterium]
YGGDEFVALLRETDAEQALRLISTLPPVVVDNENGSSIILRFSAGIACSDEPGIHSVDDWLRIADGLMYSQKVRLFKEGGARA